MKPLNRRIRKEIKRNYTPKCIELTYSLSVIDKLSKTVKRSDFWKINISLESWNLPDLQQPRPIETYISEIHSVKN